MRLLHNSKLYDYRSGVYKRYSLASKLSVFLSIFLVLVGLSVVSARFTNRQDEQRHHPKLINSNSAQGLDASTAHRWAEFVKKINIKSSPSAKKRLKRTAPVVPVPGLATELGGQSGSELIKESHQDVVSTVFWIGEEAGPDNGYIANVMSAWDGNWQRNYGGYDSPTNRNGYLPAGFTPKENPFYVALPYNDIDENGNRKPTANLCPNATAPSAQGYSWCKNSWVKISFGSKTVYAQWQDVGPYEEDDFAYVFGAARPINSLGAKAGIDVSPAIRDYLGIGDVNRVDWSFVGNDAVPEGPWRQIITTSKGYRVN